MANKRHKPLESFEYLQGNNFRIYSRDKYMGNLPLIEDYKIIWIVRAF